MFARYTLNDVRQNRFYQLPKFLFEGEMKTALSNDAKVLYSLLRDRHDLSLSNRWVNDNGEVYILFSREDMANALGCSPPTLRKIITQLIDNKLMEEERQGLNKPNLIYLNYIDISPTDFYKDEKKQEKIQKDSHKTQETYGVKEIYTPECKNLSVKNENSLHSRTKETYSQECKEFTPNDTEYNNTEYNNTEYNNTEYNETKFNDTEIFTYPSYQSYPANNFDTKDKIEISNQDISKYVYRQLEIDVLYQKYDKKQIDGILHIITDIMTTHSGYVTISGQKKPIEVVKSQFAKLTSDNVEYVIKCLHEQDTQIKNIKAYLITSLYNASDTGELYWSNLFAVNNK